MALHRPVKTKVLGIGVVFLALALMVGCGVSTPAEPVEEPAAKPVTEPAAAQQESSTPVIQKETAQEATVAPTAVANSVAAPPEVGKPEGTLNAGIRELGSTNLHPRLIRPPTTTTFHTPPIGEGLLAVGNQAEIIPQLAREWSISQDLSTWTFKLEEGVQFHKGYGEMTAEDVV